MGLGDVYARIGDKLVRHFKLMADLAVGSIWELFSKFNDKQMC